MSRLIHEVEKKKKKKNNTEIKAGTENTMEKGNGNGIGNEMKHNSSQEKPENDHR